MNKLILSGNESAHDLVQANMIEIYKLAITAIDNELSSSFQPKVGRINLIMNAQHYVIEISPSSFAITLSKALEFFKSTEQYEMCSTCKKLLDSLQDFEKSNSISKSTT